MDDTAVAACCCTATGDPAYAEAIARAREWVIGMQCTNGAWGAFDINNDRQYLNHIPFADHGALLDPPTEDVSARCISFLAQLGHEEDKPAIARGVHFLRETQMPGRFLVRALGHELYLRHLVGSVRAECGRGGGG